MKTCLTLFILLTTVSFAYAQLPVEVAEDQQALLESDDPQLRANKKLVFDFWREVFQARNMEKASEYMAEDYMQHNPNVATGRKPFTDFFGQFEQRPVKPTIDNLVTIVAERDLVILAFKRELEDPENEGETYTTTWFDMLRIEDGKIAEHWDYGTK
ncbi:nuclear transport factor 2 family protein [Aliifodinibius sp. S!AR15-10]|uniref:nuclear transport factor 2 family protein n=1 Tax=Aliifodinibius sp. S!AR15-10 TaxID=2950437 RepID=UPI0028585E5D|nr:nuclear transport factor 2 family protein [Aliifodinibius sp. S!AR15-10]MDR8393075.1 nuclear transport factor 2 family protein [Aliifodinibius sp. S!AR15-10]